MPIFSHRHYSGEIPYESYELLIIEPENYQTLNMEVKESRAYFKTQSKSDSFVREINTPKGVLKQTLNKQGTTL